MNDKQLIYAELLDYLSAVAFINKLEGLKNASPERLKLFIDVKRQVRKELQELVYGEVATPVAASPCTYP